jgi:ADP-ribose pyrophosphatase YjhB (NUDIX family)
VMMQMPGGRPADRSQRCLPPAYSIFIEQTFIIQLEILSLMKHATLCIVRNEDKILLGMKKKGFGAGKFNSFGGKVESGESVEAAAMRELREEAGLTGALSKHAVLTFKFPHKPEWDQVVHVFVADNWAGTPTESDEMKPEWFDVSKIPYQQMWTDDPHWLPHVLDGKFVEATFVFSPNESILEKEVFVKSL